MREREGNGERERERERERAVNESKDRERSRAGKKGASGRRNEGNNNANRKKELYILQAFGARLLGRIDTKNNSWGL